MGPWPGCGHNNGLCSASPSIQAIIAEERAKEQVTQRKYIGQPVSNVCKTSYHIDTIDSVNCKYSYHFDTEVDCYKKVYELLEQEPAYLRRITVERRTEARPGAKWYWVQVLHEYRYE